MSSRQEEKQQRKAEREAAEAEAARSAARKGRIRLALGGLAAIAVIAVAVVLVSGAGGDADGGGGTAPEDKVSIPAQKETNLQAAAKAGKCVLKTFPDEGNDHTSDASKWKFDTNPPTSGTHDPEPAEDGLYEAGNAPPAGKTVHAIEHGRIDIQYKAGSPQATIDKLETLGSEPLNFGTDGYHVLVFENNTEMEPAVAATAWTQSLTCPTMNDGVYDAIRAFRTEYTDKGPELIP